MHTMANGAPTSRQCLVLLVEDSAECYELYSEVLAGAGYAVVGADNGEHAYELAISMSPDLIVMDYELKGVDGCEATHRLKSDSRTADIPVVMLTGHVSRRHYERAKESGCDAFIAKPCSIDALLDEVKRHMQPTIDSHAGGTVLLVEDDDDIRNSISTILQEEGFQVIGASDGGAALRYLRETDAPPRLILLDLMMPVMDGWAFRAAQLDDDRLAAIPVVILSAATDVRRHAAQLRVNEYLIKPLDVPLLLNTIERHI
ncbi:MAG: divK [Myxococcales bacterium]|nr:divK [Myxococcales bacterium]